MVRLDADEDGALSWEEIRGFLVSIVVKSSHQQARQFASDSVDKDNRELEGFRALMMMGGASGGSAGCSGGG